MLQSTFRAMQNATHLVEIAIFGQDLHQGWLCVFEKRCAETRRRKGFKNSLSGSQNLTPDTWRPTPYNGLLAFRRRSECG
jgi:hypothetical protein